MVFRLFLPLVIVAAYMTTPGVQIERGALNSYERYVVNGGNIKYTIDWFRVEKSPGIYDWSDYDFHIGSISPDHKLLLGIRNAPEWHRMDTTRPCSDVKNTSYDDYSEFVKMVIDRYHPESIEIWNEFDATGSGFPELFGCFVNVDNYINMSSYVCNDLAINYPNVITVVGATTSVNDWLMRIPPNVCDAVSFHVYKDANNPSLDGNYTSIQNSADALHNAGWNRVWISETAMTNAVTDVQMIYQAEYFYYLAYNLTGVERFYWYTLSGNGWMHTDMIEGGIFKPVYQAYIGRFSSYPYWR